MRLKIRLRAWFNDQRGLSLIEILGAVTIMSIISVTLMGYFITGLNRSEDESRRIIAVNLARLKAAEIRQAIKPKADYDTFVSMMATDSVNTFNTLNPMYLNGREIELTKTVNGTTYNFKIELDPRSDPSSSSASIRNFKLKDQMAVMSANYDYLIPMAITVYWDHSDGDHPLATKFTAIDSYVLNRGDE